MSGDSFQIAVFETLFLLVSIFAATLLLGGRVRWIWLVPIPVVAFLGKLILFFGAHGTLGNWIGGNYNWEGKIYSTAFTLTLIILLFGRDLKQVGLTLSQKGIAPRLGIAITSVTLIATIVWNALYFPGVKSEPIIDMLYQGSMPSLDEELWFRGLLLAMLVKGFTTNGVIRKDHYGILLAAVVVTFQFWAAHSITTNGDWGFIFRAWYNPVAGIYGALWITVRLATGSLILPIILHTVANIVGYFV